VSFNCFISYAGANLPLAETLHRRLTAAGLKVWFDCARLQPGYNWHREIEEACESSRVVLPILTPLWKLSEWTRFETYGAESIIPLLAEGLWQHVSTPPLAALHYLDFNADDATLIAAIRDRFAQPPPEKAPRVAQLKYRPNPYFVGRDDTLVEIHEKLHRNPTAALTQGRVEAVTALGGVGKTTIAREYAEKFWRCYRQMFWVDCRVGIEAEFSGLFGIDPQSKQADRAKAAYAELNRRDPSNPRLLILDNAEDEDSVTPWIPRTGNCHTLITSRFTAWSPGIEQQPVRILKPDSARELLLRRSGRESHLAAADNLAQELGYLPLALEQAAAYIRQQGDGFTFADYLSLYTKAERELLAEPSRGSTEYPATVYTTWRTTIEKLPQGARDILRVGAFLSPAPIPFRMFLTGDTLEFEQRSYKKALLDYSMILPQPDDSFSVHPLVQAVERHRVDVTERSALLDRAVSLLSDYGPHPSDDYRNWPMWKALTPHGEALWEHLKLTECSVPTAFLLHELAKYAATQSDYDAAEPMFRQALKIRERILGPDHSDTLMSVNDLAELLMAKGEHGTAELLSLGALETAERVLGPEHPCTLASVNNLALLLHHRNDFGAAEQLFRRALETRERVLGREHPDTIVSSNNLALLLCGKGDYAAAEALYRRALEASEQTHGAHHPVTLISINNLAGLLERKRDYTAAEPLFRRALEGWEHVLGSENPHTFRFVNNLAVLLYRKADYAAAEPLYRRALEARERVLGSDHPDTLVSINNLAELLRARGDHATAEPLCRRALEARERVLGSNHPDTLISINNLALLLYSKGDYAAAEPLYRRALEAAKRTLGLEHPNTWQYRQNLSILLLKKRLSWINRIFRRRP
jgi:tetratricopeptide (TPR) repeat protein